MLWRLMLLLVLCTEASGAEERSASPIPILEAMQHALDTVNFQGTVAILRNAKLDTLQYFHTVHNGIEQERLLSLNSPLREVVKDADKVSCLFKASQQVVIDHKPVGQSFLLDLPKALTSLQQHYSLVTEPNDAQVALQTADVVLLKPLDQYRYTRKVWVAKATHLPLKIEVLDFTGETLEQVIFTEQRVVNSLLPVDLAVVEKHVQHIHEFVPEGLDALPIALRNMPEGFEKRAFVSTHIHPSNKAVEQLLLSDGLSSVSVYLEKHPQNFHAGLQTAGAVNSLSRVIGDYSVTVMGDVPAATVEFIAQGIVFNAVIPH